MASFATKPERPDQPSKPTNSGGGGGGKGSRPPKPSAKPKQPEPKKSGTFILIGAFVAMAVVAVLVAMLVGGGDDTAKEADKGLVQSQPVTVTGENLPAMGEGVKSDDAGGATSPVVTGKTFAGSEIVAPVAGQPTMIALLAHWCPHCQKEVPLITKWAGKGGLKGVQLVGIATGTDKSQPNYPPSAWLSREQWPGKVIADDTKGSAAQAFGLTGYPTLVFIDADGKVRARLSGEQPEEALDDAIAKITSPAKG